MCLNEEHMKMYFLFLPLVCVWGFFFPSSPVCGVHVFVCRKEVTCVHQGSSRGCVASVGRCPKHATCIWPRNSAWIRTGPPNPKPPQRPNLRLSQKMAPTKSWLLPSTPPPPPQSFPLPLFWRLSYHGSSQDHH